MTRRTGYRITSALLLAGLTAACSDHPAAPEPEEPVAGAPMLPLGVYRIEVTGIGSGEMSSTVSAEPGGAPAGSLLLTPVGPLVFEPVSSNSFTEGTRAGGGQRYVTFTYRVRNASASLLQNVTVLMVSKANTIAGTPLSSLRRFDGTTANPAIAATIVPTGATAIGRDLVSMEPIYADVIQAYTEAEVAEITKPSGVTGIFPYGYVVRNAGASDHRDLPAAASDPNRFDGVLTLSFRVPLQPTSAQDVFSLFFEVLAVTDPVLRVTESIEEQTVGGRAAVTAAAFAMGATTVTVLAGSPSTGLPGQRQLCAVRTAGTAAAPVDSITRPGAFTRLAIYAAGESVDPCAAGFRSGVPARVGVGTSAAITVRAMDRYGNVLTSAVDSVTFTNPNGTAAAARTALSAGTAVIPLTYASYGTRNLTAVGRRLRTPFDVAVVPISRTWTGTISSDWSVGGNWAQGHPPEVQDTAVIPTGTANSPLLMAAVTVARVDVTDGATLSLGAYALSVSRDVITGQGSGGITGTTGRVRLTGSTGMVAGRLPEVDVVGSYTQSGNLLLKAPALVDLGGGLTSAGWLTEVRHY
jgi:hypothetical protein